MLPETQRHPAQRAQFLIVFLIPLLVPNQLLEPKGGIIGWEISTPRTLMPKTAIHKDCEPKTSKDEIGAARQRLVPAPPG